MRENLVGRFLAWSRYAGLVAAMTLLPAGLTPSAQAGILLIESNVAASTNQVGTFSGTLEYTFNMAMMGTLVITLNNTSPVSNGGFITAFVFNIDSADSDASATLISSSDPDFSTLTGGNAQPFGNPYDSGASIDGNFQGGGGNPNMGIAAGDSATFTFKVTASDAAALNETSFLNGPYLHDFVVRFRAFNSPPKSDKVPAQIVPGPTALTVLAVGLLLIGRRHRQAAACLVVR